MIVKWVTSVLSCMIALLWPKYLHKVDLYVLSFHILMEETNCGSAIVVSTLRGVNKGCSVPVGVLGGGPVLIFASFG